MNSTKINELLSKRIGHQFLGVFSIDRLPARLPPRRPLLLVCNTDTHDKPGEHWVALYIDRHGEFFDSFGQPPHQIFKRYLEKYCNSFVYSSRQLQSSISQYCGHYTVFYCLVKTLKYNLDDIVNSLTEDTNLNDTLVHNFVCIGL